jgi:hypothetical protein
MAATDEWLPSASEDRSPDASISGLVAETARRLNDRHPALTRVISLRLAEQITDLGQDRALIELLHSSVEGNMKSFLHVLTNEIPLEHLEPSTAALEYARRLAQRGIPAYSLVRAYQMGQHEFRQTIFGVVQDLDCLPEERLRVIHDISDMQARYTDRILQFVLAVYEMESRRRFSRRGSVQSSLIHKVIAGETASASGFESETGYRLDQVHVGLVAWTPPGAADEELRTIERFVKELAKLCDSSNRPIITAVDRDTAWAWMPFGRKHGPLDMDTVHGYALRASTCRLAVGLPGFGVAGFKRSHEQAQAAMAVTVASSARSPWVISYGDQGVGAVSLLANDLEATRHWVRDVLGPLSRNDKISALLRETLHTFFITGENYAETADLMNVHRNTVKYRVTKAFEDRARPMAHDRMDVAWALQACHFLGTSVLHED